jgi:SET domain-containing protein
MLMVKTKIAPSNISGIGLFADEFIPKGTMVWKFQNDFDLILSKEEVEKLSVPTQKQFYNYAYLDKKYNKYMLCSDDARFFNHSDNFNCDERIDDITTATRDIEIGEELTVNYKDFYGDIDKHTEII